MKVSTLSLAILTAVFQGRTVQCQEVRDSGDIGRHRRHLGEVHLWENEDQDGGVHVVKRQTFHGIPMIGAEFVEHHYPNGDTETTGTEHCREPHPDTNTNPRINEFEAMKKANEALGSAAESIENIKISKVFAQEGNLSWQVEIEGVLCGIGIHCTTTVLVDAEDGSIICKTNSLRQFSADAEDCGSEAESDSGHTASNRREIKKRALSAEGLVEDLEDDQKITMDDKTKTVGNTSDGILFDIHSHKQEVLDYCDQVIGLDLVNDILGRKARSWGHVGTNYVNAYYSFTTNDFYYGDGDGKRSGPLGVLDIVAHEIGHLITWSFAQLVYENESGAISESFSDIFAAVVEAWVDGGKTGYTISDSVWFIGEDAFIGTPLRYMMSPSKDGKSPDHYSKIYRGTEDHGGVHSNSGIMNHYFYLLVTGGRHHDPMFHTENYIESIGMGEAFWILLWAGFYYFTPNTNLHDARLATLLACEQAYNNQTMCNSIENAWAEVGVGCVNDNQCNLFSSACVSATCLTNGTCSYGKREENCNPCEDDEIHIGIEILSDTFPGDNYWELKSTTPVEQILHTGGVYPNGFKRHTLYVNDYCLPRSKSCYEVTVYDTFGDGIYSPGGYRILADGVDVASKSGVPFRKDTVVIPCYATFEAIDLEVDFWFDYYAQETSWYLTTEFKGKTLEVARSDVVYEKENALEHHRKNVTLYSRFCYDFYITDTHGDGMCCDYGKGNFTVSVNGAPVLSGGKFNYKQHIQVGSCPDECPEGEKRFKLTVNTDNFGSDTRWYLTNSYGDEILKSQGTYSSNTENIVGYCLPESDCYNFTITDDYGDGICCLTGDGGYSIEWGNTEVARGGEFGHHDTSMFGCIECGECAAPSPKPHVMPSPTPHSMPSPAPHAMPSPVPHSMPSPAPHSMPSPAPHAMPSPAPHSMPSPAPHSMPSPAPHAMP